LLLLDRNRWLDPDDLNNLVDDNLLCPVITSPADDGTVILHTDEERTAPGIGKRCERFKTVIVPLLLEFHVLAFALPEPNNPDVIPDSGISGM